MGYLAGWESDVRREIVEEGIGQGELEGEGSGLHLLGSASVGAGWQKGPECGRTAVEEAGEQPKNLCRVRSRWKRQRSRKVEEKKALIEG